MEAITFKDGKSMDAFSIHLTSLISNLYTLGNTLEDDKVVKKLLCIMPPWYKQIMRCIDTHLDLRTLMIEELTG